MPGPAPAIIFLFLPRQNVMLPKLAHTASGITSLDLLWKRNPNKKFGIFFGMNNIFRFVAQTTLDEITTFEYSRLSLGTRRKRGEKKG